MKINYDRPKVSSSSIHQKKNFDQLKKVHTSSTLPFYKKRWFIGSSISLATILIGILLINIYEDSITKEKIKKTTTITSDSDIIVQENKQIAYNEDTPCVSPPSNRFVIPFETYKIDPSKKQSIQLKNATISIPSFAFLDQSKNQVSDSVILKLKVFNDPIDFILSGIPMEYDSAGVIYTFESAGMFELVGSTVNNAPIFIKKNNPLSIQFDVPENTIDFNFYELDTITKNWNYVTSNTIKREKKPFEAPKTHSFDDTSWETAYRNQNIANQKWKAAEKEIVKHHKTKPIRPTKLKDKTNTFTLDIDKNQFPELSSYSKLNFEPIESSRNISSIYTTEWNSIKLKEHKKGVSYQIILQNESSVESVIAQPVYEGKDWAEAQLLYSNKFAKYIAVLDQKEETREKLKNDYLKKKQLFDERDQLKAKVKQTIQSVSVTLVAPVIKFGICNFDVPIINRPKVNLKSKTTTLPILKENIKIETIEQPSFISEKGNELQFEKIYVIESKRNASFTYDLTKRNEFRYNPSSKISLIGFNEHQNLVLIDKNNFKIAVENKKAFTGKEMSDVSINQLKKLVLKI